MVMEQSRIEKKEKMEQNLDRSSGGEVCLVGRLCLSHYSGVSE